MGGLDFCCAISGTTHIEDDIRTICAIFGYDREFPLSSDEEVQELRSSTGGDGDEAWHIPSENVIQGLKFSSDDMEASNDYVLIAGYAAHEASSDTSEVDAPPLLYCEQEDEPTITVRTHARLVLSVTPESEGCYVRRDDPEKLYNIWWQGSAYLLTFSTYCILKTVAPDLSINNLYRSLGSGSETNGDSDHCFIDTPVTIDYGIVQKTFGQYVDTLNVCDDEDPGGWWTRLLCFSTLTDEEVLDEGWNGKGNLWVYLRPDRFPISKALAAPPLVDFLSTSDDLGARASTGPSLDRLPLDILLLIAQALPLTSLLGLLSLTKSLRTLMLSHSDRVAYKAMQAFEPWYFPSNPIKTPDGEREREDLDWWESQWLSEGGIEARDIVGKGPWLRYWVQCVRDGSMRNRKRIWRSAESVRATAVELGYLV